MKVFTPVKDFNGLRNNVRFVNGVGETDDLQLIEWFELHGYRVERGVQFSHFESNDQIEKPNDQLKEPTFEDMTPLELRDWMKANGFGRKIGNIRNKEKLLEILRG